MTVDELKARIESVTGRPFQGANGACPAHDDAHESLSVNQGDVAPVLTCHAGCETAAVLGAAGLALKDLFDVPATNGKHPRESEIVYPYTDENGQLLFEVVRFPGKKFRQRAADGRWSVKGVRTVLYRLPEVAQAIFDAEPIWIAEGEKDADALARAGVVATCNPMGAGKWRPEHTEALQGAERVTIVADQDEAGLSHARQVAAALSGVVAEVRILEPAVGKDAADHLAAGRSVAEFVELGSDDVDEDVSAPAPVVGALSVNPADLEPQLIVDNGLVPVSLVGAPAPGLPAAHVRFLRDRLAERAPGGPDLSEFPTELLPRPVAEMVEAVTVAVQVPADLPGMLALAVLSAATCGRLRVDAGWPEMANLYVAVLAESAERKSAVFDAMTGPLLDAERRLVEQAEPEILEAKARKMAAEERARNKKLPPVERVMAEEEAAAIIVSQPRLLADDATAEALTQLLVEQGGRMAVVSDEGGMLRTVGGRYTGTPPVWDVLLKGHANTALRVDRKGAERPEYVASPALSVGLAVQPHVIHDLANMPGARERGLLARFLYARPRSRAGYRSVDPEQLPDDVAERYRRLVVGMVEAFWHRPAPVTVELNDRAREALRAFMAESESALRVGGDLAMIGDWGGKLHGAVVRIAGLYQAASCVGPGTVGYSAMSAAIEIGRYLIPHAVHVFGERASSVTDRETAEDALRALVWAKRTGRDHFDHRELQRSQRGWSAERARAACASIPEERARHWRDGATVHVELT